MTFSENQVRHLYVANSNKTDSAYKAKSVSDMGTAAGAIALAKTADGKALYFQHVGKGGLTRSDLIPVDHVLYAQATDETDMEKPLKTATIALVKDIDGDGTDDTAVPAGTYIVRITIHNYVGMSDEDTYFKYAQVTSNGTMTSAKFYAALLKSLKANFSREVVDMFEFSGGETNVVITEKEQPWHLGTMQRVPVLFDVELVPNVEGYEVTTESGVTTYDWGTVTVGVSDDKLKNSKDIADLEYFSMGERADIYRQIGWPYNIPTEYMVDGSDANGYCTLDIHYSYVGGNESCQQSEKTITIVAKEADKAILTALVTALQANVTGLTVKTSTNW